MLPHVVAALLAAPLGAHASRMRAPIVCDSIRPPTTAGSGTVVQVAPGDGGRVAWTDASVRGRGAPPPIVFVRDGRGATHTVGRAGAGPGEFRAVSAMSWRGDTLWVSDGRLSRIQAFTDNGAFLSARTVSTRAGAIMRPGGSIIAVETVFDRTRTSMSVSEIPLAVVATQGSSHTDTLLRAPPLPPLGDPKTIPELTQKLLVRGSADGGFWCTVNRGPASGIATSCADASGHVYLQGVQRWSARTTTDSAWGAAIAVMTRDGATRSDVTDFFHRPATLPLAFDLLVNRNGEIWVLRTHPLEAQQVWDRLSRDGKRLASVIVAGHVQIRALDGNWYYAADTDADDLQTLIRCAVP